MKFSFFTIKHLITFLAIAFTVLIISSCATEDNTSSSSSIFEGLASWGVKARANGATDVIVTGFGYGDVSTDSGSSESNIFLARHDSSGDFDWLVQPQSTSEDFVQGMIISGGNVYIAGYTYGELEAGAAEGGADCFIMQYDPVDATQDWVQQYGTAEDDFCWGIASEGTNLFVVGNTGGTFTGSTNTQGNDIFILRVLASNGEGAAYTQWGKDTAINSNVYSQSQGVAIVNVGGSLIIGGVTNDSLGGTKIGGNDLVFAAYDTGLNQGWTKQIGTAYDDSIGDMVFSTDLYVTGFSYGTPDASYDYSAAGYSEDNSTTEVFVYSIDASGDQNWVSQIGSSGYDRGYGIEVNGSNVYIAGNTAGDLAATNAGSYDFFIASFGDASGDLNWKFQYGSDVYDTATGIAFDGSGNIMITGRTFGTLNSQSNSNSSFSAFVIKYDASPDNGADWTKVY